MIRNISKNKVLIKKARLAKGMHHQILGLMFKSKISYGLVFSFYIENKHYLHTCFMKEPIDILFLDSNRRVLKVMRNVKPWRFDIFGKGKYVIELPAGKSFNTKIGDKISFK
ncbi:MAG: DUF192 domain-containing protein [Nanoarchaeota archaeon]